jgi:hypothetical protein
MGFEVDSLYRLQWPADSRLHGMEVSIRSLSLGTMFRLDGITAAIAASNDRNEIEDLYRERAAIVALHIDSWNLERQGEPLKVNAENVLTLEARQVGGIIDGWIQAVTAVEPPLPDGSHNGEPFPEGLIPMESLSSSPEN